MVQWKEIIFIKELTKFRFEKDFKHYKTIFLIFLENDCRVIN